MEWQPIETAPRDGTEFLCFKRSIKTIVVCTWLDEDHPDCDGDAPHVTWDHSPLFDATHWAPLPPPPQQ